MISVTSLATSKPLSEPSVQQKPTESEIRDLLGAIASARYTAEWIKNEVQLPVRTERQVVNQPVPIRPIPIRPIVSARTEVASSPEVEIPPSAANPASPASVQQVKKPGVLKRLAVGLAVFGGVAGAWGIISIVVLGPVGLAISGGSFLLAAAAIATLKGNG